MLNVRGAQTRVDRRAGCRGPRANADADRACCLHVSRLRGVSFINKAAVDVVLIRLRYDCSVCRRLRRRAVARRRHRRRRSVASTLRTQLLRIPPVQRAPPLANLRVPLPLRQISAHVRRMWLRRPPLGARHELRVPRVARRVLTVVNLAHTAAVSDAAVAYARRVLWASAMTASCAPASAAATHGEPRSPLSLQRLCRRRRPRRQQPWLAARHASRSRRWCPADALAVLLHPPWLLPSPKHKKCGPHGERSASCSRVPITCITPITYVGPDPTARAAPAFAKPTRHTASARAKEHSAPKKHGAWS